MNHAILALTLGFSAIAMVLLMTAAASANDGRAAAIMPYATTLEASALCSFLYHLLHRVSYRRVLRYLDHAAIFLLIAGTYTPLAILGLPHPFGTRLVVTVWCLALAGMFLKLVLSATYDRLFVAFYVALGLSIVVGLDEITRSLASWEMALLVAGGGAYLVGVVFYIKDSSQLGDAIWHALVLCGAVSHFGAIYGLAVT